MPIQITINIPADKATRFLSAVNYQATIKDGEGNDIPNPETGLQYGKRWVIDIIKHQILAFEADIAGREARALKLAEKLDIT